MTEAAEARCTRHRGCVAAAFLWEQFLYWGICSSVQLWGPTKWHHGELPSAHTTAWARKEKWKKKQRGEERTRAGAERPPGPAAPRPPLPCAGAAQRPLPLRPLTSGPCGQGTQFWGTSHLATSSLVAPPASWHVGLNLEGREGTLEPIPLTLSWRRPARFQAAHAVPGLGAIPQRGRVIAAGPPGKINAPGPAAQHGTGIPGAWPSCLLSARPRGAAALNTNICVGSRKKNTKRTNKKEKEI